MCGIAGIFVPSRAAFRADAAIASLKAMTLTMGHRGPDGHGHWADETGRCFLGHRRLSIIDTSDAGLQPMSGADGRWVITFNGEIYNYRELKPELQALGVQFKGRTDTEVLLEAVARWGHAALPRLDGMFAFAAFDRVTGKILLARDAFGEKPLYYTTLADGAIAFASELQALELLPGFDAAASLDAMAEVLTFQYIGAPRSIYQAVRKLEPGCWMEIDADGDITTGRYFQFEPRGASVGSRSLADLADELEDILVRSLERRLIADVPLGAFLSGGVDSSVVCALVRRRLKVPLKTFSTGFSDAPESEHLIARAFAEHLGTEHYENLVSPDVSGFLDRVGGLLDEPNGDSSCLPTFLLSQFVREHVTVAVSGDGGDEMFGGYGRYFATLEDRNRSRSGAAAAAFRPGEIYYGNRILVGEEAFIRDLFGFVPEEFEAHLGRLRGELNDSLDSGLLEGMRRQDVDNYLPGAVLPKVDRMSMRNSLEVRTPFLNVELARFAQRLPESVLAQDGRGKLVLRELAYRYLPRDLIDLPKKGFGLPMSDWARGSLLKVAQDLLLGDGGRLASAFGWTNLNRYFQHQSRNFSAYQLWGVVMLEQWLRQHPAVLPNVGGQPSTPPRPVLDAVEVAPSIYLVAEGVDAKGVDPLKNPAFNRVLAPSIMRIFDLAHGAAPAVVQNGLVRLPTWGEPLNPATAPGADKLAGATLVFAELGAMSRFDYPEYNKYLAAGVRRILLPNPVCDNEVYELELRRRGRLARVAAAARLFRNRAGGVACSSKLRSLFGLQPMAEASGHFKTGGFETIEATPDVDITNRYALFEGHLQLLPLHGHHHELERQSGRYSVWNQGLFFSPIVRTRAAKFPYWFVPINAATEPHLPIGIKVYKGGRPGEATPDPDRVIGRLAARSEPVSLRPGDRVVVHTHSLPPGGAERQWLYLAQALKDAGYDVVFVTSHPLRGSNGHYLPDLVRSGIAHVDASHVGFLQEMSMMARYPVLRELAESWIGGGGAATRMTQLAAVFEDLKPKVVFAQLDEPNVVAGLAALAVQVPRVVVSFRNYNPTNFPYLYASWFLPAYQLLARSPNTVFSGNFHGGNEDYARWIGIEPARVAHVPNAIEPRTFPPAHPEAVDGIRKALAMRPADKLLLGVFRLSEEKNPFLFVDICIRLCNERKDLVCAIAGAGRLERVLLDRIDKAGLAERVRLLGPRRDMNVIMSAASLLLQTSEHEGMPNAVMEAQMLGVPVVATAAGGTVDVVVDGKTGVLCPLGDEEALIAACCQVLDNPAMAKAMGDAARKRMLSEFRKDQLAQRYLRAVDPHATWLDPEPETLPANGPAPSVERVPSA
jgi:asparagine synthase (glutamine-hydrolysing)